MYSNFEEKVASNFYAVLPKLLPGSTDQMNYCLKVSIPKQLLKLCKISL